MLTYRDLKINEYLLQCSICFQKNRKIEKISLILKCPHRKCGLNKLQLEIIKLNYKTNDNITGYIEIFNYTGNIIFNSQIILYYDYNNKKIIHYLND